jgi:hypothetical protein
MIDPREEPDSVDLATLATAVLCSVTVIAIAYAVSGSTLILIGGLVALTAIRPAIRFARRTRFKWHQRARDEFARRVAASDVKGFFLYLRPFCSTGRLSIILSHVQRWQTIPGRRTRTWREVDEIDLETEFARALEPYGNLVGLGHPGEHAGAGRAAIDDADWQGAFVSLAERADAIFVVPATTEGTSWELDQLLARREWARKTYLVVPPSPRLRFAFEFGVSLGDHTRVPRSPQFDLKLGTSPGDHARDALRSLKQRGFELDPNDTGRLLKLAKRSGQLTGPELLEYSKPRSGMGYMHKVGAKHGVRAALLEVAPHLATRTSIPPTRRIELPRRIGQHAACSIASGVGRLLERDLGPPYLWRSVPAALGVVSIMAGLLLPDAVIGHKFPQVLALGGVGLILVAVSLRIGSAFVGLNLVLFGIRSLPPRVTLLYSLACSVLALMLMVSVGIAVLTGSVYVLFNLQAWRRKGAAKAD